MDDGIPNAQIHTLTPVDGAFERRTDPAARLEDVLVQRETKKALRWRARLKVWVPILATAFVGGGVGVNELELLTPTIPAELQNKLENVKAQSEENAKQNRALGKVMIESYDYLGDKIDAAHPEVIPVEKPESLKTAEENLEEQKKETRLNKVLDTGGLQE